VHCPFCGDEDSRVVDSRDSESGDTIRRRRECGHCGRRYTTYERVEEAPLLVVKRSGAEEVFARAKLLNGLLRACEKRHISLERIERISDEIEGELRRESVQQVTSVEIGERALRYLRDLDRVAYIRFASVYRQFDDIDEFQSELARLDEPAANDGLRDQAADTPPDQAADKPHDRAADGPPTTASSDDAPVDQPVLITSNRAGGMTHD
jgi:transcriptional repressor NrdR